MIGRSSSCTLQMVDPYFSRRHLRFYEQSDGVWLEDLNSRNGIQLNGVAVGEPRSISNESRIQVGRHAFVLNPSVTVLPGHRNEEPVVVVERPDVQPAEITFAADNAIPSIDDWAFVHRLTLNLLRQAGPEPMLQILFEALLTHFDAQRGFILRRNVDTGAWKTAAAVSGGKPMGQSRTLLNRAVESKTALMVDNAIDHVHFSGAQSVVAQNLRSVLLAPLVYGDQVLGVIQLDCNRVGAFGAKDLSAMSLVAQTAAATLHQTKRAERAQRQLLSQAAVRDMNSRFVGEHPSTLALLTTVRKAAKSDARVVIEGESGTGKELIARMIHEQSHRANGPFVALNCAAIPDNLIESELFGHEKGAFTGATKRRLGSFEQADGGTLFLDEVAELPLHAQSKLLRVLQEQCFYRLGSERAIQVDVRVVAATHQDLSKRVASQQFREDLYYRLNVISLWLPPLRERLDDLDFLVPYFIKRYAAKMGCSVPAVHASALSKLKRYPWPGNVRELQNTLERAMVFLDSAALGPDDISLGSGKSAAPALIDGGTLQQTLRETERRLIVQTLKQTGGNKSGAARILGISRPTLDKKLASYEGSVRP